MPKEHRNAAALAALILISAVAVVGGAEEPAKTPKIAALVTVYYQNSHAEMFVSRLLQTETLDGKGRRPNLQLVSLYTDQIHKLDTSRRLAAEYKIPIYKTIAETLTLGTGKLAVDGVFLVAEHGDYPESQTGQFQFPKRRMFDETIAVFRASGRVVPLFFDKHLADTWEDAEHIYKTCRELKIPLIAGSSLPVTWRYPAADTVRDRPLKEIVTVSYHRLDSYGIHALELSQALAERRKGGETGVKSVQCYSGPAVWEAGAAGVFDAELLQAALGRLKDPRGGDKPLKELIVDPVLFSMDYVDGLRLNVLTLEPKVAEWASAWRYADDRSLDSTLFFTQEWRPFDHFSAFSRHIEQTMLTGQPPWPAERTLLTTGALDFLLRSKLAGGKRLDTPALQIRYEPSSWNWQQPPPPPPNRPLDAP